MKYLRQTITNLILEMQDPYEEYEAGEKKMKNLYKLMDLIKSGDPENINQALELSAAMEYIDSFSYEQEFVDGYATTHRGKYFHYYELVGPFDEDFLQTLRSTQKYGGKYFDLTEPDDEVVVLMFVEDVK